MRWIWLAILLMMPLPASSQVPSLPTPPMHWFVTSGGGGGGCTTNMQFDFSNPCNAVAYITVVSP